MPNMADITVKKADGTTDVTYSKVASSAGDKSPAVWRSNSVGSAAAQHPELRLTSQSNGTQTGRRVNGNYSYPSLVTSADTGVTSIGDRLNLTISGIIPLNMTDVDVAEAVVQGLNCFAATLVKDSFKSGFAPT
jgi:hypothetical protein